MARRGLLGMIFMVILATVASGGAASGQSFGPKDQVQDQLDYTVEECKQCGTERHVRAYVKAEMPDRASRDQYAGRQMAQSEILASLSAGPVPVLVTLNRPLSVDELRELMSNTGLIAELLTFEARDDKSRLHTVGANALGRELVDLSLMKPDLDARGLRLVGVTVVRGTIQANASSLGRLIRDSRVYIADTTPHRVAKDVAARYGVPANRVQVIVPSPHWILSSER